ncbi:MAG: hypothetical protein IPL64_04290 [Flavobacteriales bacterium]|nr:hypothetical protein [Flavobacteriales bacterium]
MKRFFNDALVGAQVHVDRLKGTDGELGLRVGNADYFGVVNVGDEKKLSTCARSSHPRHGARLLQFLVQGHQ